MDSGPWSVVCGPQSVVHMNEKVLQMVKLGLTPVLLGRVGEALKRPQLKGWQTAEYGIDEMAAWPMRNNLGIRCGRQRDNRCLIVFDFDEEAGRVFPVWQREAARISAHQPVIVSSGRGFHVYFYIPEEEAGRTLAARYSLENGRRRLHKFIETLGRGRQVVSAGSRHPSGRRYRFVGPGRYGDIPPLGVGAYQALVALSERFDERPRRPAPSCRQPARTNRLPAEIRNCLDYARCYLGAEERVERNGDIRFLGQGGLLVTADGRGWYSFSDEMGGGLAELVAWHQGGE
jgi:hypothetical protein